MSRWSTYYDAVAGRPPRPLLLDVLKMFADDASDPPSQPRVAVDLGSGDGTEALALLDAGWRVCAVDSEPAAARRLTASRSPARADRLSIVTIDLAEFDVPPADLVWASLTLFFLESNGFAALWRRIRTALLPGGRFAGQFLGTNDSWASDPGNTALTEQQVRALLAGLDIERFDTQDSDGVAVSGPKHWHLFHVVARRPA